MKEHHLSGIVAFFAGIFILFGLLLLLDDLMIQKNNQLAQVGAVGVAVGVAENEVNRIYSELEAKEEVLKEREKYSETREAWLREKENKDSKIILYMSLGGALLLLLVIANFYFEYSIYKKDQKEIEALHQEIDHEFEVR